MHLKLLQKEQFKKQHQQLVIWLVIKLLIQFQKFQKTLKQNNSETIKNDKEIPKESYISPEDRQKIIDDSRLI